MSKEINAREQNTVLRNDTADRAADVKKLLFWLAASVCFVLLVLYV